MRSIAGEDAESKETFSERFNDAISDSTRSRTGSDEFLHGCADAAAIAPATARKGKCIC